MLLLLQTLLQQQLLLLKKKLLRVHRAILRLLLVLVVVLLLLLLLLLLLSDQFCAFQGLLNSLSVCVHCSSAHWCGGRGLHCGWLFYHSLASLQRHRLCRYRYGW